MDILNWMLQYGVDMYRFYVWLDIWILMILWLVKWGGCVFWNQPDHKRCRCYVCYEAQTMPFRTLTTPAEELEASATCVKPWLGNPWLIGRCWDWTDHWSLYNYICMYIYIYIIIYYIHALWINQLRIDWSFLNMRSFKRMVKPQGRSFTSQGSVLETCLRVHQGTIMLRAEQNEIGAQ